LWDFRRQKALDNFNEPKFIQCFGVCIGSYKIIFFYYTCIEFEEGKVSSYGLGVILLGGSGVCLQGDFRLNEIEIFSYCFLYLFLRDVL
jgi:hypothetical protein